MCIYLTKTVLAFFWYQRLICIHSFTGTLSFNACRFSCWQVPLVPICYHAIASLRHQSTQDILLTLRKFSQSWWQYGKVPSSSRGSCELSMCLWRDFMEVRSSNCAEIERKRKKHTCIRVWVLEEEGKVNKRQNSSFLYLSCTEAQHAVCSCNITKIRRGGKKLNLRAACWTAQWANPEGMQVSTRCFTRQNICDGSLAAASLLQSQYLLV